LNRKNHIINQLNKITKDTSSCIGAFNELGIFDGIFEYDTSKKLFVISLKTTGELDSETKDKLIADVKFSQAYNVLYTAKSEDGKPCPLYRNNNIEKVKDTCASKACTEASVEAYKLLAEGKKLNKNDVTVYENILKALQDCDKTVAENGNNGNSTVADGNNAVNGTANAANSTATNSTNSTQANVNNVTSGASEMMKYTMAAVFAAVYLLF